MENKIIRRGPMKEDGGGIRQENHLLLHKYIKNSSEYGTTSTEHLLNASKRPQTFKKASQSS